MKPSKLAIVIMLLSSPVLNLCAVTTNFLVAKRGQTEFTSKVGASQIRVSLATREIDIGHPTDPMPTLVTNNCTYSSFPCSVIDNLQITVDGEQLFIPRSVFADLGDVHRGLLRPEKNGFSLELIGGDASEAYGVRIFFTQKRVSERQLYSLLTPRELLQKTIYYETSVLE